MHIMFDMKNGLECFVALPTLCECCDDRLGSTCDDEICPYYPIYLTGERVIYKGSIGSSLIALLSLDLDLLKRRIISACSKSNKKSANTDFDEWAEQFDLQQLKSGVVGALFMQGILYSYYSSNRYRFMRELAHEKSEILQVIRKNVAQEFTVFECVKTYIDGCIIDNTLYEPMKFKFASEYLLKSDQEELRPLKTIELAFGNLNYNFRKPHITPNGFLETLHSEYEERMASVNPIFTGYDEIYQTRDINLFAVISLEKILEAGYRFKTCENCSMPFIPYNRTDTKYCDRASPQDKNKTCKEYGARQTWQKTLKEEESAGLYRRIYMSKQMLARRNPDIPEYQESFNWFKAEAKRWKAYVKSESKTTEEYITWLKSAKEKKVL